jgi:hypothetical protein
MNHRKRNHIGHCTEGTSDKVYIIATVKNDDGTFSCEGRYGRRNGNMKVDIKASHVSKAAATAAADKLIANKFRRRKGAYIDIDSQEYNGVLTRQNGWLSNWIEKERPDVQSALVGGSVQGNNTAPASTPAPKPKKAEPPKPQEPEVLVCVNNVGLEDQFDEGVEYFVKKYEDDDFVQVIDKCNEVRSVFRERFAAPEMATA